MRYRELLEARLDEYSREKTAQNYGSKLFRTLQDEPSEVPEEALIDQDHAVNYIMSVLEPLDPTKNKTYTPWLAREYAKGESDLAVMREKAPAALHDYDQLKKIKAVPDSISDIGKVSFSQFVKIVSVTPDAEEVLQQRAGKKVEGRGSYENFYDGPDCRIVHVKDQKSANYYGRGTKWCTTSEHLNMFNLYNGDGPLYVILPKNPQHVGEKFQIHAETDSFRDEEDTVVDVMDLCKRFPAMERLVQNARSYKNNSK